MCSNTLTIKLILIPYLHDTKSQVTALYSNPTIACEQALSDSRKEELPLTGRKTSAESGSGKGRDWSVVRGKNKRKRRSQ